MSDQNGCLKSSALHYADLGYSVFPCIPGGKEPLSKHGFKDATTDLEQIEKWWEEHPNANIGMSTAGMLVVDVDGKDNRWPDDENRNVDLSFNPISNTPRGGCHHLFRQPKGKQWKNTAGKLAQHVDTRANGGYIVVPPSVVAGKPYTWTLELDVNPDMLAEPPAWLVNAVDELDSTTNQAPTDGNVIPSGQRNDTLARLGGAMRRVGMGRAEILAALLQTNVDRCSPPISRSEVKHITDSICRYEPDQIAVAVAENHWGQIVVGNTDHEEQSQASQDPGPIPDSLLHIPGFVTEVMDYCLETAPYPNRIMAFCGALSLLAFLSGQKVRDAGDNRTNIYLLGLAHSAAGKDWPRKINTRIAYEIGLSDRLGDRFASGEGIQDALFVTPCMLFQTDEIDGLLLSINKAKDARHESILGTLMTMYSSANGVVPMRRRAGRESPGAIDQPCLVVFGTAIPNHYYQALSERMLTNGFFARMLILESAKRGKGQEPKILDLPPRVIATARWWADFLPGKGNLQKWHPVPVIVEHTEDARRALVETREEADSEYALAEERSDAVSTTVWGRVGEQVRKLALLFAISVDHKRPRIDLAAVQWACRFVMHQTRRMLFMAKNYVADNPFHADCLKITQKLREAPDNTMAHSQLLKRMKVDSQSMQKIVQTLLQQGTIEIEDVKTSGRSGVHYRLIGG